MTPAPSKPRILHHSLLRDKETRTRDSVIENDHRVGQPDVRVVWTDRTGKRHCLVNPGSRGKGEAVMKGCP